MMAFGSGEAKRQLSQLLIAVYPGHNVTETLIISNGLLSFWVVISFQESNAMFIF